ncbi:hypothetical protein ES703_84115 [subsurface metagenome]
MKRKTASEIFHPVDPGLNVIDRRYRTTGRKGKVQDWEKSGGALCSRCKQEAVRFRPRDGLCLQCVRDLDEKQDRDDKKRARQLKFINQHNARIDKKKRGT